jgi:hypothetical protein
MFSLPSVCSQALPGAQLRLFRAILALGKPVVVFLMNAGPVDVGLGRIVALYHCSSKALYQSR